MRDIWGLLLQTLTASGAAVLLLVVKAMFRDKLSPRWQFASWGVLAVILLIPAGIGGRYALFNWPLLVEAVKTIFAGEYSITRVIAPIPLPKATLPENIAEWAFAAYCAVSVFLLVRYLLEYAGLRLAIRKGLPASTQRAEQIRTVAGEYGLDVCRAVEVHGLSSAFICGVVSPVMVLPADSDIDDKVILHELLHLNHHDVVWGLLICFFRCIHWCNPLLWYCADRAGNDLEALCDQRVLERLEGENRREYGRILLSMVGGKFAKTPGTSSIANGGWNIKFRIESIARFKHYPKGMALVSVCVAIALAAPLLLGCRAKEVYNGGRMLTKQDLNLAMASARTLWCTTYAGAIDTYGKALLERNGVYRAMCAPLEEHAALAEGLSSTWPAHEWDGGLPCPADTQFGYQLYNPVPIENGYEAFIVVQLAYPPDGKPEEMYHYWLAAQRVRAEKRDGRWVIIPLEGFQSIETEHAIAVCEELPAYCFTGIGADFQVNVRYQYVYWVDSTVQDGNTIISGWSSHYDTTPKPDAEFDQGRNSRTVICTYVGDEARKSEIKHLGVSTAPVASLTEERPVLANPGTIDGSGSSTDGSDWSAKPLEPGWGPEVWMSGSGGGGDFDIGKPNLPAAYAADLYINGSKAAELILTGGGLE